MAFEKNGATARRDPLTVENVLLFSKLLVQPLSCYSPQRLKPSRLVAVSAWLKPCPSQNLRFPNLCGALLRLAGSETRPHTNLATPARAAAASASVAASVA